MNHQARFLPDPFRSTEDMDLGTLYFGWPLPSNDFDVTMANDGSLGAPRIGAGAA